MVRPQICIAGKTKKDTLAGIFLHSEERKGKETGGEIEKGRGAVTNMPGYLQTTICWRLISAQRLVFPALFCPVVPASGVKLQDR